MLTRLVLFGLIMNNLLVFGLFLTYAFARQGFGPGEQDWDYVTVRFGAHKFWWLYETTARVHRITEKPLIIWLQGGPGASSTGYGNFGEIGPLDENLNERSHTWVKDANLLFIDNPVGTGYSYVDNLEAFTTNNLQIAYDLIACLEGFYQKRPEFRTVPLYVASESYGGKMAAEFALELYRKIKRGEMNSNLQGVNMIDSWISPIDSVLTWAPFLFNVGIIDHEGYIEVDAAAQLTKQLLDDGRYEEATAQWSETESVIMQVSKGVDFYNIMKKIKTSCSRSGNDVIKPGADFFYDDPTLESIDVIMNTQVKEALKINRTWGSQSESVFEVLAEDFMKPVTHIVEQLLDTTDLKVQVVTGQLDLIVDTPGTILWVDKLQWSRSSEWPSVPRNQLSVNNINEGYKKILGNFGVYWVNRAGHMVPADNPAGMSAILRDLLA